MGSKGPPAKEDKGHSGERGDEGEGIGGQGQNNGGAEGRPHFAVDYFFGEQVRLLYRNRAFAVNHHTILLNYRQNWNSKPFLFTEEWGCGQILD